jgi:cell wall-associated protease
MAPDANLMPIRVADAGGVIFTSYVDRGIRWAVDHGADVINISLGLTGGCSANWPTCRAPVMDAAISYAAAGGVPVVAASGNNSNDVYVAYPANHPDTIAVGASTSAREVADYSDGGHALDLVAPGGEGGSGDGVVQETFGTSGWGIYSGSGTSSAAPHVSGAVALLRSLEPNLPPEDVLDLLVDTALDIEEPGRDDSSGAGLLQADAALDALAAPAESDTSIVGGTAVVSDAVASRIARITGSQPIRLWGPDRFSTASEVSGASNEPVEPVVYIATGRNFPDALAAGPVAALQDAPILLVNPTSIPSATRAELTRLEPHRIVILGGPAAVSSSVEAALAPYATLPIGRVAGASRYTTAVAISESFFTNPHRVDTVYLATGLNFPDALSAGPAAALAKGPILLTSRTSLPPAVALELLRLDPERVVIVGGAIAVSSAVQDAVESLGFNVDRFNGATRYHTSALVVADAFQDTPVPTFVATGANFPDALAASAAIGSRDGALLLTTLNSLPSVVAAELDRLSS